MDTLREKKEHSFSLSLRNVILYANQWLCLQVGLKGTYCKFLFSYCLKLSKINVSYQQRLKRQPIQQNHCQKNTELTRYLLKLKCSRAALFCSINL